MAGNPQQQVTWNPQQQVTGNLQQQVTGNPQQQVTGNPQQQLPGNPFQQDTTSRSPFDSTRTSLQDTSALTRLGRRGGTLPAGQDSLLSDSAKAAARRASVITDTTYVVYLDSTARLSQFRYERQDQPQVTLFPRRTHPLFASPRSGMFRREVVIDTATSDIVVREMVGGVDVKVPSRIGLSDYIAQRRRLEFRKLLAEEAQKPPASLKKDDLGELLSTITQIQIPIPPNPIFSIFGKPEIRLNISGAVDIKAGFRNTKSDYTTVSRLDQSRNEPDFSQDVQVNVNGTIGDKLNILADWNTKRTFEYENQLKLKYTGYEDEIVRSVEAGNVSLQTPSAFIGSSQALFGVKAQFQAGPLTITGIASQKKGQIKEVAVSGGSKEQAFEFRAFEYATNHFFVDTSYISQYEPYYRTDPATVDGNVQIVEEEVWVLRQGTQTEGNDRSAIAYIDLSERGNGYNDALRDADPDPGRVEVGPVVRLDRSQYELAGDGYIGVLSLNTNVGDQQFVGISYRRADGRQFGELTRDFGTDSAALARPIILKLVRPKNLLSTGPKFAMAWKMLLKNIYPIPGIGRNLKETGFSLDILRRIPGGEDENSILGDPLLRVML
ncbi:MAG: hypothetical protein H6Q29_216, partial [Bacteroidetes bacterium]|nr:hypothetical protein [Bacteroidota bacterium]